MKTRTNPTDNIAVGIAILILMLSPMISATATILLASICLIGLTLFASRRLTEGGALSAIIGFVVAILIAMEIYFLHQA